MKIARRIGKKYQSIHDAYNLCREAYVLGRESGGMMFQTIFADGPETEETVEEWIRKRRDISERDKEIEEKSREYDGVTRRFYELGWKLTMKSHCSRRGIKSCMNLLDSILPLSKK